MGKTAGSGGLWTARTIIIAGAVNARTELGFGSPPFFKLRFR